VAFVTSTLGIVMMKNYRFFADFDAP